MRKYAVQVLKRGINEYTKKPHYSHHLSISSFDWTKSSAIGDFDKCTEVFEYPKYEVVIMQYDGPNSSVFKSNEK